MHLDELDNLKKLLEKYANRSQSKYAQRLIAEIAKRIEQIVRDQIL